MVVILKNRKLYCELEPVNNDYGKEMLDENTSNLLSQKYLTYEFSTLDKVALKEAYVKLSLGQLKTKKYESFNFRSNQY